VPGQQRRVTKSKPQPVASNQGSAKEHQRSADGHAPPADERCAAIAVSTEERCQRFAVDGTDYCPYHLEDLEFAPETTG
jgi:hypothetical protein